MKFVSKDIQTKEIMLTYFHRNEIKYKENREDDQRSVHLWAPGCNIYTTTFHIEAPHSLTYNTFDYTPAAAPHVAGVAALMLSIQP